MASENILAFFIPFILRYYLAFKYRTMTDIAPPLASPIVFAVAMRRAAFAFVLFFVGSAALILYFYTSNGGGGETGQNIFNLIVKYFLNYFDVLKNAMTPMGWVLLLAVVIFPLVVVTFKLRQLTDIQKLLPITYACFLVFVGIIAFSQSTGFSYLHFWKWEIGAVHDEYLLCMAILGSSILTMMILGIFSVDVFYRNYSRIFREIFDYDNEDEEVTYNILRGLKISLKYLRLPLQFVPVVVLVLIIPYKFDSTIREMSSIVNKIARQAADECGDAKMVFTDGSYDGAIEVAAFRKGKNLKTISMMSGTGAYDVALRLRGESNQENIDLLKIGAADALRTWVHGKFDCVSNIAIQVGFELWQFNKLPVPQAAGLVARTARFEDDKLKDYVSSAKEISENILSLYKKCDLESIAYPELNKLFVFGQWRLARMCRMRANAADHAKNWKLSEEESALADRLDKANPEWNKVEEKTRWISLQGNSQLTPREGLKLGLARADFRMASSYAKRILDTDPDDMNANFALGMKFFTEKLYEKAEFHLKKCLVRSPDEPAVLNNLAVVQFRLGKLYEAETNAVRALNRFPSSHEIKATLRHIKDARKEMKK
jgi:tetratricopeptide (TPR) repeat protein